MSDRGATREEVSIMRHMLGADSRLAGFRNHGAYEPDDERLSRMVAKGLVCRGRVMPKDMGGLAYFHVADEWCAALGIKVL